MDRICTGLVQPPPIRNFLDIIPSASTDGTATYKNVTLCKKVNISEWFLINPKMGFGDK